MLTKIDGVLFKKMLIAGANELMRNKQLVDSLNVFPVPDGDTGTNMSLTCLAAAKEVDKSNSTHVGELAKLASNGSLRGARGNSGVILSQLFRGFAKGLKGKEEIDAQDLAIAFEEALHTAYKAVMKPKEGTILTVSRALAEKSGEMAFLTDDLEKFLQSVLDEGKKMLDKTKEMLPVLKEADVVDAGGKGLLCILEGACQSIHQPAEALITQQEQVKKETMMPAAKIDQEITFGYCTEFFINVENIKERQLKALTDYYSTIGDSMVVVHDEEIVKIHVHSDHPGLILEKALTLGSLSNLKIENMREQHTSLLESQNTQPVSEKEYGFISVAAGSGITALFQDLGVDFVIEGGQTMNPSTEDIIEAVQKVHAKNVFILPNNKNIILAAQQAAKLIEDKSVVVVETKTIPQGFAAMVNFRPDLSAGENMGNMSEGIKAVQSGQITYAVRDTQFGDIQIHEGDILGMKEGEIVTVGEVVHATALDLLACMADEDTDLISVYYGEDVKKDEADYLYKAISEKYPDCEIEIHEGKQPLYYYIISVE